MEPITPDALVFLDFGQLSAVWAAGFVAGCSAVLIAIPVRIIIRAARVH